VTAAKSRWLTPIEGFAGWQPEMLAIVHRSGSTATANASSALARYVHCPQPAGNLLVGGILREIATATTGDSGALVSQPRAADIAGRQSFGLSASSHRA
jgi:hypothetical protein